MNRIAVACEVVHDIFSLAQSCGNLSLRLSLERDALFFLRAVARQQLFLTGNFIASCEALIVFGSERDFFEISTAPCLNKIRQWQSSRANKSEVVDRKHNSEDISEIIVSEFNTDIGNDTAAWSHRNADQSYDDQEIGQSDQGADDLNMEVRQRVLLTKIGELQNNEGGCGLKELLPLFPGVTDRTLRSDLKKMLEKGLITRIGTRGPNTVYRLV